MTSSHSKALKLDCAGVQTTRQLFVIHQQPPLRCNGRQKRFTGMLGHTVFLVLIRLNEKLRVKSDLVLIFFRRRQDIKDQNRNQYSTSPQQKRLRRNRLPQQVELTFLYHSLLGCFHGSVWLCNMLLYIGADTELVLPNPYGSPATSWASIASQPPKVTQKSPAAQDTSSQVKRTFTN